MPAFGVKADMINRCPPISIYEYTGYPRGDQNYLYDAKVRSASPVEFYC